MSRTDFDIAKTLIQDSQQGRNVFSFPLINDSMVTSTNTQRTVEQVKQDLIFQAAEVRVNNIPMMTPDEIASEYSTIMDKSLTLWDEQPTTSDIENNYRPFSKRIFEDRDLLFTIGFGLKQWTHAATVTHPRSQRNFLQDYSHLRSPMRKYLLSHSVNAMNRSIVDFAQKGGLSCFHRCMKNPGEIITEDEKRCVHFCGETLADVRKILATDYLNYSEDLENMQVPVLPAGNEMGDKETGFNNASNRASQWNQYARRDTFNPQWVNTD